MVFSKLTEFVSSRTTPKASNHSYKSAGLPPVPGSLHDYTYTSPQKKSNLRLSSSLQDFSTYHRLDLEGGDITTGLERTSSHALPPNLLHKGNDLSFSKEKAVPGPSSARKKWARVICILFCLLLLAFVSFTLQFFYSNWSARSSKFYVVIDCGSTGTRVYVYQASVNHNKESNLPIVLKSLPEDFKRKSGSGRAYSRMETEPGFDKLVHNTTGLRKAMKPLILWAKKQIPESSHRTTSIFLYATAGVRRLPGSDSEWLLNNAWLILKDSPFFCKREWVKIISGVEEAYYGWIALNYHSEVLGSTPKKETYGALDLGGSSLQVTFEDNKGNSDETSLNLSVGPVKHHLSAYSLAGYGLNDAFDKSVTHLFKKLPQTAGEVEIEHPCLHSGYKEDYMCSNCASVRLENGSSSPSGEKMLTKGRKAGIQVKLIGVPKWDECSALAKIAVNGSEWSDHSPGLDCELQPCALAANLPRPVGQFYAMSGFFVVFRFFNLSSEASLDAVLEKGHAFCDKTWDVARKSVAPQPFIEQYCFRAPYVVLLLREGLHIDDSHVTIASGSITWTLGVALFEAGKAFPYWGKFYSYEILQVKINPVVLFAIMFASLGLLLCALTCSDRCWVPKFLRRVYLPLLRHDNIKSSSGLNIPAPFRFRRWSPVNTGDGRVKTPLSPTVAAGQHRPFDNGFGLGGGGIQLADLPSYSSPSSVAHSYSSGNLGQMQFDNNTLGSFWTPNRGQNRLQSRRSQSREDLVSSIADAHLVKS